VTAPEASRAVLALGHGAGGDMNSPILGGVAEALAAAQLACLRFNFPYKEQGRKSPDPGKILVESWRQAFAAADQLDGPVWVGGKSIGGRIASMAVAEGMPASGLIFFGYPLHPPGRTEKVRDEHLYRIEVPMLFIQGTEDPFAQWELLERVLERLGNRATLLAVERGDHSFKVKGEANGPVEIGRRLGAEAAGFILEHT
jgi:predicted alpha/beta-hydrolase family hydrolase